MLEEKSKEQENDILTWTKFLALLQPSSNIEITNYFNYENRINGVFSRDKLPIIKDGAYVINLDDKQSKGTLWVSLFIDRNTPVYFDSFEIKYIPQKNVKQNPE